MDSDLGGQERGAISLLFPLLTGCVAAVSLLTGLRYFNDGDFTQAGLGNETASYFAQYLGHPIHGNAAESVAPIVGGFTVRGAKSAIVWLGNSQLHGVNQYQPGQSSAPEYLFHRVREQNCDVLTISPPNGNLQEHLLLFEHLRQQLPVRMLLLPVVLDDMRETGIRDELASLTTDVPTREALQKSEIGRRLLATTKPTSTSTDDLAGLNATVQESVERALNAWLDRHFSFWAIRSQARGAFFVTLIELRDVIFRIDRSTARPVIASRYAQNRAALEAILAAAQQANIEVLVYVPPVRQDVGPPYGSGEYHKYKEDLAELTSQYDMPLVDFDALVPGPLWGELVYWSLVRGTVREYDFMHFQAGGHKLLADALADEVMPRLDQTPP